MKLSIVTINYNNAEGLRKTLASVASQTYADIEHIIVDGGSTDGSVAIIEAYASDVARGASGCVPQGGEGSYAAVEGQDSTPANGAQPLAAQDATSPKATQPHKVTWVSEPDKGIYNAMNKGIEIALEKRIVNSFNRSELVEDKNKGIEIALGKRVVNDDHTSKPHRLSDYIQILNSGDILAADDVTERMMAALEEKVKQQHQQKNTNNHSVMEQHTITANDNNTSSPHRLIASSPKQNCPAIFYGNMIKEYPDGKRVEDRCFGDRGVRKLSDQIRKTEWTMYDFIRGTINHDPTYIRSDIYIKYGLYDDSLKIVSDWKWFVQAVVFGAEEVYYIPMDVTIFDMTGISETNLAAREKERRIELEKMFPMAVLKDYDAYHFPINQIQRLKRHHLWPLVYFMERILFKLEKWGILKKY